MRTENRCRGMARPADEKLGGRQHDRSCPTTFTISDDRLLALWLFLGVTCRQLNWDGRIDRVAASIICLNGRFAGWRRGVSAPKTALKQRTFLIIRRTLRFALPRRKPE